MSILYLLATSLPRDWEGDEGRRNTQHQSGRQRSFLKYFPKAAKPGHVFASARYSALEKQWEVWTEAQQRWHQVSPSPQRSSSLGARCSWPEEAQAGEGLSSAFQNCFSSPQLCRGLVLPGARGGVGQTPQALVNLTEEEGLGQVAEDGTFLGFTASVLEQKSCSVCLSKWGVEQPAGR